MAAERACRADDHPPKLGAATAAAVFLTKEQQQDVAFTISHLEGTLLRDSSFFPFYMLMALEAGSPLRALLLLLLTPILWILSTICTSEALPIKLQVFVATVGLKLSEVRAVGAAVLPKFFLDDLEPAAYRAFFTAGAHASRDHRRCIVTAYPRPFVEHFLKTHLHIDVLLASELLVTADGTCTGFLLPSQCLLSEDAKREAVENFFDNTQPCAFRPTAGIHVKGSQQHDFLCQCQETILVKQSKIGEKVPTEEYLTPLVFHDGRLVIKPTPLVSLLVALWAPIGLVLAIVRIVTLTLPYEIGYPLISFLGLRLRVKGTPPPREVRKDDSQQKGVMFACVHRTLADPTFVALALRHNVRALVFGTSKLSEFLTPIPSARLTRNREEDATIMKKWLETEDLCICPEGTTCREPYLLRFSPLFADVADWVAPVGVEVKTSIFHGTSARGYKFMDGIFLFMNPIFAYEVTFLDPICTSDLRKSGKSAIEIANLVQKQLGAVMGFKCTNFTRRDKYFLLAGHDGT